MVSDFRSDTVTRPTPEMRVAMAEAEVGDDVLDGDPTVGQLERSAAEWLGKQAALYVPSGTMANQVALGAWTRPGDEIICGEDAHILRYEAGAAGYLHGVQSTTLPAPRGQIDPVTVGKNLRPDFIHCPETTLVCVEQTHMGSGGSVVAAENFASIRSVLSQANPKAPVPMHMDGARLAHAVVASGQTASHFTQHVDSVSLCFSKGLGAPVGSVVAGDEAFIERAKRVRKRLGGWMRQAGIVAAGALWALENGVQRLEQDHQLAKQLAEVCSGFPGLEADPSIVQTNLVPVRVTPECRFEAAPLSERLREHGVLVMPLAVDTLRFVTHRDVGAEDVQALQAALGSILS